jgi:hypothetical protein
MYLYTASIKPFPARTVRCYVYNRKARPFFLYIPIITLRNTPQPWGTWYHVIPVLAFALR